MSLIIKDKIQSMMRGYPTVSDKYNVQGGINEGEDALLFGDAVMYGSQTGYYKKAKSMSKVDEFAGFVVATNVKLEDTWGAKDTVLGAFTYQGEAFNLFVSGWLAVSLKSDATLAQIKDGAKVAIVLAGGDITTIDKADSSTIVELPGYAFTGMYEKVRIANGQEMLLAEIRKIC